MRHSSTWFRRCAAPLLIAAGLLVSARLTTAGSGPREPVPPPGAAATYRGVVDQYCVGCHNQRARTAGITLDTMDLSNVGAAADTWERVIRQLRAESMPPPGRPRPDADTYRSLASWLEGEIDRRAAVASNPGRTEPFHRLNRSEYQNAIRDLLALDVDAESLLPADNTFEHGFDNNGDLLSVSPDLMARYLSAARKISRLAVGVVPNGPSADTYRIHPNLLQDDRLSEALPFGSRGGMAIRQYFPVDGEYAIRIRLHRNFSDYIIGFSTPHRLDVRLDGAPIAQFTVGGQATGSMAPLSFAGNILGAPEWEYYMNTGDAGLEVRFRANAGPRIVGVSFLREFFEIDGVRHPRQRGYGRFVDEQFDANAAIDLIAISGPYTVDGPGDTPSRRRIFTCRPSDAAGEPACARTIVTALARRAYRRPVSGADVRPLLDFFAAGRRSGSFDDGIQFALERILVDPDFLYRIERDPAGLAAGAAYRLRDIELASRLSFFLWSSIPDDELLAAATAGQLRQPGVLERQVRRMLGDARASSLTRDFAAQWLRLRNLRDQQRESADFPEFDENLRDAFRQETELFVESTRLEDRSVVDLLGANYTFLNERLARHYGIPGVYGSQFRRVALEPGSPRAGLLGHGGLLTLTSHPNRTSPVLRGKWLLESMLGTPPPEPPANVPGLPDRGEGGRPASVRERLEIHRRNPVCASCHAPMDPLGFALENFDAIGSWRDTSEAGTPIDASGTMPGGARFDGPAGLRALLLSRRDEFARTVTEKLLAYALGRGLEYYDRPTVRTIAAAAAAHDYRWSSIVLGIVRSAPFQMRRTASAQAPASVASLDKKGRP